MNITNKIIGFAYFSGTKSAQTSENFTSYHFVNGVVAKLWARRYSNAVSQALQQCCGPGVTAKLWARRYSKAVSQALQQCCGPGVTAMLRATRHIQTRNLVIMSLASNHHTAFGLIVQFVYFVSISGFARSSRPLLELQAIDEIS
ncbi:hypothetical protein PoB_000125300 [Plakobranchus ocellatus]|uniref:Uncharacterized protein n=1 Tax=Plakobranchus ocellatus TaxID=259542 RepID=A0AAV3XWK8_9GAST|nr:hypothetical protein PoB_000125300 [Plakobranchus ocellatus]